MARMRDGDSELGKRAIPHGDDTRYSSTIILLQAGHYDLEIVPALTIRGKKVTMT